MEWFYITSTKYAISKTGMLKNTLTGKVWPGTKTSQGYYELVIEEKRRKVYRKLVHVILAEMFLNKPSGDCVVDHKDNNKMNNSLDNLEYLSRAENTSKGLLSRDASTTWQKVIQYTLDGEFIAVHESIKQACITIGVNHRSPLISYACKGACSTNKCNTAYGYIWKAVDDDIVRLP